jgi:UDP-N-acetylglucosamine:LPS N-acetylglucosamine transferase
VLKPFSLDADVERFTTECEAYVDRFPHLYEQEAAYLSRHNIALVISDISPIPFVAASLCGIPSIGISNFTWHTAYRFLLRDERLQLLYNAYSHMSYFISLPGAIEPHWGRNGELEAGFFCRAPIQAEVERIKQQYDPDGSRILVFIALGMSIVLDDLMSTLMWQDDDCLFIVSSNMAVDHHNVIQIPADETESQNYVAASDVVITKPGWGTISEAVSLGKPLILLKREQFQEDDNMLHRLKEMYPYHLMEWEQLRCMEISKEWLDGSAGAFVRERLSSSEEVLRLVCEKIDEHI